MKKIVIFLGILLIIFLSVNLYIKNNYQTVECWWGVMYPSLSFIALEDEEENTRYSSLNTHFVEQEETEIKYDFMILKWLREKFSY